MSEQDLRMERVKKFLALVQSGDDGLRQALVELDAANWALEARAKTADAALTEWHCRALAAEEENHRLEQALAEQGLANFALKSQMEATQEENKRLREQLADSEEEAARQYHEAQQAEAKLARVEKRIGSLVESIERTCAPDDDMCHGYDLTDDDECALVADLQSMTA